MATLAPAYADDELKVHSVTLRLESRASLAHKLARPDRSYGSLWSVTDLIGLRVIVYFEDAVDAIGKLLETHLPIDFAHSIDKRRRDAGTFGYRSLHYVCRVATSASDDADQMNRVFRGYSLFFLAHAELLTGPALGIGKVERLAGLYRELDYPDDERAAQRVASKLVDAFGDLVRGRG